VIRSRRTSPLNFNSNAVPSYAVMREAEAVTGAREM
jgi:hypothetical protein